MKDEQTPTIGRLAVIGAGTMGETLIAALLDAGRVDAGAIVATAKHGRRLARLRERFGVATSRDNRQAAQGADVVLLAVKPQVAPAVLAELAPDLGPQQLLISIVAGLTTARMESLIGEGVPVARAMPNTPSRIRCGMTAVCGGRWAEERHTELARQLFASTGRCLVLDEKYFDAVTGLSASGPAFLYIVIEALAEGGVKVGLPRTVATELAAQTCLGAARMVLDTGHHPALLKDEVTTPAGCTMDGILTLEEGGLRVTLIKAVVEATRRARELVED
ncbi:MAG: pyrroline-5-carboxylate reductase [Acidobacteria bacterium]|nr:MAG: pyrroline-5-carboxylate reductase [Acidobacteriota bacterium]